jgi:3-hydroxyacyl-[acyl-carrier-protein] dehydratase
MLDIKQIQEILPHRYPLLLVDRILELEPGKRAVGIKNVTVNEDFFNGHFPGNPIMPGVLVMEAMAQVGGVLLLSTTFNEGKLALFGGADHVRFRRQVLPGDQLVTEVTILRCRGTFGRVKVVGRVDGQVAAEAEYLFALVKDGGAAPAAVEGNASD